MRSKRTALWIALLLAATSLLAGCGARSGGGETATTSTTSSLLLDVPALVVDYDAEGKPSLGSIALSALGDALPETLLNQLTLDSDTVATLTGANLQHIQISNTPTGLRLLANGQPLPTIVWDRGTLANLINLLGISIPGALSPAQDVMPLLTDLGAGIVLRFPPAQGADLIPLVLAGDASNAAVASAAEQAFVASAGSRPTIHIPVTYATDGTWTVLDITDTQWQALTGLPFGGLRLSPGLVQSAAAAGIDSATLRTDERGVHLALNGAELPYLSWEDGSIITAIDMAQQAGLLKELPIDQPMLDALLATWLPALQSTDLSIEVTFPTR